MEKKIKFLYRIDNFVVLFFVAALWAGILFVLNEVLGISPGALFSAAAIVSSLSLLVALTATSFVLCLHLKKNKIELYTQDIVNTN